MRIGIVNDSPIAVEALRRAIAAKSGHQVAWIATNGVQAVANCSRDTPDLVLMDLIMPGMDGVEATRQIMASAPCAILIVTVDVGANTPRVFEAMGHGALDAVNTPTLESDNHLNVGPLITKIETIGKLTGNRQASTATPARDQVIPAKHPYPLIAIGASAGGPVALARLLAELPANFSAAVVLVQHVDTQFAEGMAQWLNQHSRLPVKLALEGDRPIPATVLLAATADHLVLKAQDRLGYTPVPRDYVYRPSVDVFFESVVRLWRGDAVGVLLTGMGRDGALGLKAMRDEGYHTIAQDKASSAVYGMPKAAVALNAATEVLPLDCIAARLTHLCSFGSSSGPSGGLGP
ncbi:chemotaxis response regulator protein-glutamate methylesterase [Dyella subtropica]|uniref:chemotaxis response regulator protein-glutamate methylesterase n=1 Tax=Dyella subtropica TaxID=2992127 RepID=UPI0022559193|nr:chemotaxis response regulator protein-glutamate methylesterase [Dyella subtropica]